MSQSVGGERVSSLYVLNQSDDDSLSHHKPVTMHETQLLAAVRVTPKPWRKADRPRKETVAASVCDARASRCSLAAHNFQVPTIPRPHPDLPGFESLAVASHPLQLIRFFRTAAFFASGKAEFFLKVP
jgi:hypothetical protein